MQWQTASQAPQKPWLERFFEQPHQLFFVSALFWAIVTMGATFAALIGATIDFALFHGFGLFYGVFSSAFMGFLFTVLPKYTNAMPIARKHYVIVFELLQAGVAIGLLGSEMLGRALVFLALAYSAAIFFYTIKQGRYLYKQESKWLAVAVGMGAVTVWADTMTAFWAYLVPVVFVVAQRMIPLFYAGWFNEPPVEKPVWYNLPFVAAFWTIALGYFAAQPLATAAGSLTAFALMVYFLYSLNVWRKVPAILWILPLGMVWMTAGLGALFVETAFGIETGKLGFHMVALGALLTLLVGFGTRVILGHSGQKIVADRFAIGIFVLAQAVIAARLIASGLQLAGSPVMTGFLHLAAWLWIVLFVLWGARHYKTLLRLKS